MPTPADKYPHLSDTPYPDVSGVDVYKYRNEFDYERWQPLVKIRLLSVKWDGIQNMAQFSDAAARDAWFAARGGDALVLDSAFYTLPSTKIALPVPFDVAARYNYLQVTYTPMTSAAEPLAYETGAGVNVYYYFIKSMEQRGGSTTFCELAIDWHTTYFYDMQINYCMLERGHAPMAAIDVDTYLQNPLANNQYLLTPDISAGAPAHVKSYSDINLNGGTMWGVIATTGDLLNGGWDECVPANILYADSTPAPGTQLVGMLAGDVDTFLNNLPVQALQTIVGLFFIDETFVYNDWIGTRWGVNCWRVLPKNMDIQLEFDIPTKDSFDYPARYKDITKLYTYPYATYILTDQTGTAIEIHIEDTGNYRDVQQQPVGLLLHVAASLTYPAISINGYIGGVGTEWGSSYRMLTFKQLYSRNSYLNGRWWDTMMQWEIPIYQVYQDNTDFYDFATRYQRAQAALAASNSYSAGINSANLITTNQANTNANNSRITELQNTTNALITTKNKTASVSISNNNISTMNSNHTADRILQQSLMETDNKHVGITSVTNSLSSIVTGTLSGGIAGLAGATVGAVAGSIGAAAALNAEAEKVQATSIAAGEKVHHTTDNMRHTTDTTWDNAIEVQTDRNDLATQITAWNNETAATNAANSRSVAATNTGLAKNTADSAIANGIAQAALGNVNKFGITKFSAITQTRAAVCSLQVLTQLAGNIATAGDEMLRYGYTLNQAWDVTDLTPMPHFSYWQAREMWITPGVGVPEDAIIAVKAEFARGITLWQEPSEIGDVSIYAN